MRTFIKMTSSFRMPNNNPFDPNILNMFWTILSNNYLIYPVYAPKEKAEQFCAASSMCLSLRLDCARCRCTKAGARTTSTFLWSYLSLLKTVLRSYSVWSLVLLDFQLAPTKSFLVENFKRFLVVKYINYYYDNDNN